MKYVLIAIAVGSIISYHITNVNHICESPKIMGRGVIKQCSKNEALNIPSEQQMLFGRAIVK